jgi:FtsH-binding integral membrane protein
MNSPLIQTPASLSPAAERVRAFMGRVYMWMFLGLSVTGGVALYTATNEALLAGVLRNYKMFALVLLGFVLAVSFILPRLSAPAAGALFFAYSAALGAFLSVLFVVYQLGSLASIFFISAGLFGALSLYGTVTKKDLSAWGTFLFIGLLGIVGASLWNLFWPNAGVSFVAACAGVLVFGGLTAYDTQKLREMALAAEGPSEGSLAIQGALRLYLDFINLFLSLLRLFGQRR